MKKRIKVFLAVFLCLTVISGCAVMAFSAEDDELKTIYFDTSGSEKGAGLTPFRIIDENGNEIKGPTANKTKNGYALLSSEPLPASYDSRTLNIVTPCKNQGSANSCWAFSTMSCLETDAIKNHGAELASTDFSESHLVWFGHNPNTGDGSFRDGVSLGTSAYSIGGNWQEATAALSRWVGINNESDFPFSVGASFPETDRVSFTSGYITGSVEYFDNCSNRDEMVKEWIINHGSVMVGYYNDDTLRKNDTYYCPYEKQANHAVVIIGWDDNFPASSFKTDPGMDGAWLVKNSWGTKDDIFRISYADKTFSCFAGFSVLENSANDENSYMYNYSYSSNGYNLAVSYKKVANVYTAKGNEALKAVSFHTYNENSTVTACAYKLSAGFSTPEEGEACCTTTMKCGPMGFYTMPLSSELNLDKDDIFSIVLRYESDDTTTYIPLENGDKFNASEGQSFGCTGSTWKDLTKVSGKNYKNFPIQAITSCRHVNSEVILNTATCTTAGKIVRKCDDCSKTFTQENVVLGHDYIYTTLKEASCTQKGEASVTCSRCTYSAVEPIELKPHTPGEEVKENEKAPTCTEDGSYEKVFYCTVCTGEISRTPQTIDKLGHKPADPVRENEKAPTCTEDGSYDAVVYCTECKAELSRTPETLNKPGHTPATPVRENEKAPTYEAKGSYDEVVYCSVCKAELSRTPMPVEKLVRITITNCRNISVDYRSSVTLNATSNVAKVNIAWYDAVSNARLHDGPSYTVDEATESFSVYAAQKGTDGKPVSGTESEPMNVTVNTGFFAKIIAFFRDLFGLLPVWVDNVKQ